MVERILVVCGAGASSTFLVHAMRREMQARGSALTVEATTLDGLARAAQGATLVLVAHHIEASAPFIRALLPDDVRVELLPSLSPTDAGAASAVDIVENALSPAYSEIPRPAPQGGTHA